MATGGSSLSRVYALIVLIWSLATVTVGGCASPTEGVSAFGLTAPLLLQDQVEREWKTVKLEHVVNLVPPDTMHVPPYVESTQHGVFVFEYSSSTIWRYDYDGRLLAVLGEGRGEGPGEMINPGGVTVRDDTVYVLDFYAFKVNKFLMDGSFVEASPLARQGLRIAGTNRATLLSSSDFKHPFGLFSSTSIDTVDQMFSELTLNDSWKYLGFLTSGIREIVFVNRSLPFFVVFSESGAILYARATIDFKSFVAPDLPERTSVGVALPKSLNGQVSVAKNHLFVQNRSLFDGDAVVVDVYDLDSAGAYLYSWKIPFVARSVSFYDDFMTSVVGDDGISVFKPVVE